MCLDPTAQRRCSGPVTCGVPPTSQRDVATSALRIGVLAPIAWRTPPRHYGPWELFASLLADGLVAAGHDVTLFATADSITTATLRSTSRTGGTRTTTIEPKVAEALHIAEVFEHAADLDVIHNGFDFLPLTYSGLVDTPVVTTIHGFSSPRIVPVYERYDATTTYVAISDADRHPALHYAATIHHGIDTDAFAVDPHPGDHLLFFGRIHPDKGTAGGHRGRRPRRPPPRHRRHHPRPALLRRTGRARTSTATACATSARSPPPTGRPCSAPPTPSCTSSTSTNRSATASSRRWHAAHRSSPTTGARCPS